MQIMPLLSAKKWQFSLLLFACCCERFATSQNCDLVRSTLTSLQGQQPATDVVYDQLESVFSSYSTCQLKSTCCSTDAEDVLKSDIAAQYQASLEAALQLTVPPCVGNTLNDDISAFLGEFKMYIVELVKLVTGDAYSSNYDTLFDPFFNYLENGIISKNLCEAEFEFQLLYFEVYLTGFTAALQSVEGASTAPLSDVNFHLCFYLYFLQDQGEALANDYSRFEQRMNLLFRFIVGLETSDAVLNTVLGHVLSPECHDSLLRLTKCAQCAGVSDTTVLPCKNFCQNVQRGCAVDIYELGDVYNDLYLTMKDARFIMGDYNPFSAIELMSNRVINLLSTFEDGLSDSELTAVETQCSVNFRQKRSLSSAPPKHQVVLRQTPPMTNPLQTIDSTISCAKGVSKLLRNIPNELCPIDAVNSDNADCWNGTTVDSYFLPLSGKDRISQANNAELKLLSNTGLLYKDAIAQLKNATAELRSCTDAVEYCEIKLCGLSVPSGSDFDLSSDPKYQPFYIPGAEPILTSSSPSQQSSATEIPTTHSSSSTVLLPSATPTELGTQKPQTTPISTPSLSLDILEVDESGSATTYLSIALTIAMALAALWL